MFTLTRIFNDLCAEDQWVPLTSLLRLGSETWSCLLLAYQETETTNPCPQTTEQVGLYLVLGSIWVWICSLHIKLLTSCSPGEVVQPVPARDVGPQF